MSRNRATLVFLLFTACDGSMGGSGDPTNPEVPGGSTETGGGVGTGHFPGGAANHARCGWIGPGDGEGVQAFVAHASYFDVVHPAWYQIGPDGIAVNPYTGADDAQVLSAAKTSNVRVWPLVAGVANPYFVRTMMNNNANVAAHVRTLVDLAVQHGYEGLDIDYEGLWTPDDRAPFTAFIQLLTSAMHAAGKQVSIAGPALTSNANNNAWDYPVISGSLDIIHLMGYDYHFVGGDHVGPVSPLGWVEAAAAFAATTGKASRFVMGVPNYGVGAGYSCSGTECAAACGGGYETVDTHMASCSYGVFAAGRSPHCGSLYFDDVASIQEKVQAAHKHGLGGITYWNIGREPSGWFEMIKQYY